MAKAMPKAMPKHDREQRCRTAPGTPCNDAYFKLIGVLGSRVVFDTMSWLVLALPGIAICRYAS
jgi:hypothetical protein